MEFIIFLFGLICSVVWLIFLTLAYSGFIDRKLNGSKGKKDSAEIKNNSKSEYYNAIFNKD